MPHPMTIFETLATPLAALAVALTLLAVALAVRATARRRRGPVADVLDEGAPNAGSVDVLVVIDVSDPASDTAAAATRVLGARIRRLTLALLGDSERTSEAYLVDAVVAPVEVFRPVVLLVPGDVRAATAHFARTGAYDVVVVSEDFDADAAAAIARRTGTPVLRAKEPDRSAVPAALTSRGSRS